MKRKTNLLKGVLTGLLTVILSMTVSSPVSSVGGNFTDVRKSDWFFESVEYVYENGLMKGVASALFDPEGNLTRGMCVTILFRIAGEPETSGENIFSDAKGEEYYAVPVLWASNSGIVYGRTTSTFVPDGTITRAEFAAMLFRYINSEGMSLDEVRTGSPPDINKIPSYAKDAVLSMYKSGIINGREGGVFDPEAYITRAETAAMIERFVRATRQLPHIHSYKATVTNPTCLDQGFTTYSCMCGDSYVDDTVPALGHDWGEWLETTDPTCTEDGFETRTCACCGEVETRALPTAGHNLFEAAVENKVDPTCTIEGRYDEVVLCSACGAEFSREEKTVPALGHDYVATVIAPNCTEDGYTTYVCSRCDDNYISDIVQSLGHDWSEWLESAAPACTEDGSETRKCERCGETETRAIPATGHSPADAVVENKVDPTCTIEGSYEEVVYCSVCGTEINRETKTILALDHDYIGAVTEPTCTEGGYTTYVCSKCNDTHVDDYVVALGHDYVAAVTEPTCTESGYTTHTCSRCNEKYVDGYIDAFGHSFGEWFVLTTATPYEQGLKIRVCELCGASESEPIPVTVPKLVVSYAEASPGGTVTLIVSVENNPGFNAFNVSIDFDSSVLRLDGVSLADGIPGEFGFKKYAVWITDADYTADGPLLVLSFTVNEGISTGQTQVTFVFEDGDFSNYAEEDVFLEVVPGIIDVIEP